MGRGAWWATVHRVAKSRTRLRRPGEHIFSCMWKKTQNGCSNFFLCHVKETGSLGLLHRTHKVTWYLGFTQLIIEQSWPCGLYLSGSRGLSDIISCSMCQRMRGSISPLLLKEISPKFVTKIYCCNWVIIFFTKPVL